MGQYYERLREVAGLDYDDSAEADAYASALAAIAEIRALAAEFRSDPGMTGQTATAALTWLATYEADLDAKETELSTMVQRHELARSAMSAAKSGFGTLSPTLLTPFESRYLAVNGPFVVGGREISGATYVNTLRAQRDAERDLAAKRILDAMNTEVELQRTLIHTSIESSDVDDPAGAGNGSGTRPTVPGGGTSPAMKSPTATLVTCTAPTPVGPPPSVTCPAPTPDDQSPDLSSPDPDGPIQGYVPPSVTQPDDPRWSVGYTPPGVTPPGGVGAGETGVIVGGVIGTAATVLASRALATSGMSGASALALQAAAGSGSAGGLGSAGSLSAAARVPGGGLLTGPAAAARATSSQEAALGAAARPGAAGATAGANGGRSNVGSGRAAGRDHRGLLGGQSRKDKAKRKEQAGLVGYTVQRLDADDDPGEAGRSAEAGSVAQLGPIADADAGDRW